MTNKYMKQSLLSPLIKDIQIKQKIDANFMPIKLEKLKSRKYQIQVRMHGNKKSIHWWKQILWRMIW